MPRVRYLPRRQLAGKPAWLSMGIVLVLFLPPLVVLTIATAKRVHLHVSRAHYTRIELPIVGELKENSAVSTGTDRYGNSAGSVQVVRHYLLVEDPITGDRLRVLDTDDLEEKMHEGKPLHFLFNPQAPAHPLNRRLMLEASWPSWTTTLVLAAVDILLVCLLVRVLRGTTSLPPAFQRRLKRGS